MYTRNVQKQVSINVYIKVAIYGNVAYIYQYTAYKITFKKLWRKIADTSVSLHMPLKLKLVIFEAKICFHINKNGAFRRDS